MKIDCKNFIVVADDNIEYLKELVEFLEIRMSEILFFFNISELKEKKKIVIWTNRNSYKKHIEQFFEFNEYMCADTNDGNINILSLKESRKCEEHKYMTLDDIKQNICHEFVHICQQELEKEPIECDIIWFWEALATNIGNPEQFEKVEIYELNDIDNFNNMENNYSIAFTIGKYMLENLNKNKIIEYIKYPKLLKNDESSILQSAIEYSKKKNKNKTN